MLRDSESSILVLGGGIAGLLTTAGAKRAGLHVTVVEQWPYERSTAAVPHADQLHNLLGRAQRSIEGLLPSLASALTQFGGMRGSVSDATHVYELGVRMPERRLGRELWSISRLNLERAIRSIPETEPDELIQGRVDSVVVEKGRCRGVCATTAAGHRLFPAKLTVDCLGATTPIPSLLKREGCPVPRQLHSVRQWYATAVVTPSAPVSDFWLTFPFHSGTRGGLVSPAADGTIRVSLNGGLDDPAPRTATEFRAYAATLPDPGIADVLANAAIDSINLFRKPRVVWNRYDRTRVDGLVAVGDASASLNPLLGQGVSGAAWEAEILGRYFADEAADRRYTAASAGIRQAMWDLMTIYNADSPLGLSTEVWQRIAANVAADASLHRTYVDVWHLLAPVTALPFIAAGTQPDASTWGAEWH